MNVRIQIDTEKVKDRLETIFQNVYNELCKATYDYCKYAETVTKAEVLNQKLVWRGNLFNSIRAERVAQNSSNVSMNKEGIDVDSMKRHWVSLKKGRSITDWAMTAPNSPWRGRSIEDLPKAITVSPHPFIRSSLDTSRLKLFEIVQARADKGMEA